MKRGKEMFYTDLNKNTDIKLKIGCRYRFKSPNSKPLSKVKTIFPINLKVSGSHIQYTRAKSRSDLCGLGLVIYLLSHQLKCILPKPSIAKEKVKHNSSFYNA